MEVTSRNFAFRYVPMFVIPNFAKRYLGLRLHSLFPKIDHMYKTCDRRVLLWHVNGLKSTDFKHAPRLWCARRTRVAFLNAMRERGFDGKGRRIRPTTAETQTENARESKQERDLTGTLTITMNRECMSQDFGTVQSDINGLLDTLLGRLRSRPWEFKRLKTEQDAKKQLYRSRKTPSKQHTKH